MIIRLPNREVETHATLCTNLESGVEQVLLEAKYEVVVRVELLPRQPLHEIIHLATTAERRLHFPLHLSVGTNPQIYESHLSRIELNLSDPLHDGAVPAPPVARAAAPRRPQHGRHHGPEVGAPIYVRAV